MKKSRLWGAISACALLCISANSHAVAVPGQGTWETTLLARDFDGDTNTIEGYYDTVLNITWLANANYAGTFMDWATANSWATGLDINGITGWRLPETVDVGNDGATYTNIFQGVDYGFNITTHSEMSHMFYETLGNLAFYDTAGNGAQPGYGLTNTGPFSNLQNSLYWSATEYAPNTTDVWRFTFDAGRQDGYDKALNGYAWAVHPGDVGASIVPVPAAAWLFGSGLFGLIGIASRRKVT